MSSTKRITQKEFNETVRSNIEDLDMEVEEAIEDAVQIYRQSGFQL